MRVKNIPVDIVEIKEPIHAFAWEPIGSKFAIIHGEQNNTNVTFYTVKAAQKLSVLSKLHLCIIIIIVYNRFAFTTYISVYMYQHHFIDIYVSY